MSITERDIVAAQEIWKRLEQLRIAARVITFVGDTTTAEWTQHGYGVITVEVPAEAVKRAIEAETARLAEWMTERGFALAPNGEPTVRGAVAGAA